MASDYHRVANIIHFLSEHYAEQPSLDELAGHFNLSKGYIQRLFTAYVGVSPQRFVQQLLLDTAKERVIAGDAVLAASLSAGLSGPGRLHDLFVTFDAITPGEFKNSCSGMVVKMGVAVGSFGRVSLAVTERGICWLGFPEEWNNSVASEIEADLQHRMPGAVIQHDAAAITQHEQALFSPDRKESTVFVSGTNFQVQVWRALLSIPEGKLVSYGNLAKSLGRPKAARAVGTAVGSNPVSFLIPCHRVLRETGTLGGYRWGLRQKRALLAWEMERVAV